MRRRALLEVVRKLTVFEDDAVSAWASGWSARPSPRVQGPRPLDPRRCSPGTRRLTRFANGYMTSSKSVLSSSVR
jgi:hypothetical protein